MLNETCTKVRVTMKKWSALKSDKALREQLAESKGAEQGWMLVQKALIDRNIIKRIAKQDGHIRNNIIQVFCLPWGQDGDASGDGWWLLPNRAAQTFLETMESARKDRERLIDELVRDYEKHKAQAMVRLGAAFNRDDYPTAEAVKSKFRLEVEVEPLPSAGDLRLDLTREWSDRLVSETKQREAERTLRAVRSVAERVMETAGHLSQRLSKYDPNNPNAAPFRDSTVEAVKELADILPLLNITNDPALVLARQRLIDATDGVTPDALREDDALRQKVAKSADAAVDAAREASDRNMDELADMWGAK